MDLQGIVVYSVRALRFALAVELVWLLLLYWRRRNQNGEQLTQQRQYDGKRCILVFYLAALLQITVIRGGLHVQTILAMPHNSSTVQLVPLFYTIQQAKAGWWAVVYPVCGNLLWFLPLGYLLPQLSARRWQKWQHSLWCGLLLSCTIEVLQWLLGSGISDIDDVLFNGLGALLGYGIFVARKKGV